MKNFVDHTFSLSQCEKELKAYIKLLAKSQLDEQADILPFFRQNLNLCALIAFLNTRMQKRNKIAHEYHFWGDFRCDLAVGGANSNMFCFIEFEDGKEKSIFQQVGKKNTKEYSPRFEHGFSQIIDWFSRIDGFKNTKEIKQQFGSDEISFMGVLIIGRSIDLDANLLQRLKWRQENVTITSQKIHYLTFDDLKDFFERTIDDIKELNK